MHFFKHASFLFVCFVTHVTLESKVIIQELQSKNGKTSVFHCAGIGKRKEIMWNKKFLLHLLEKLSLLHFLWVLMLFFLILFYYFLLFLFSIFWRHPLPLTCTPIIAPWEILAIRKKTVINSVFPLPFMFNSNSFKWLFPFCSNVSFVWSPYL